MSAIGALSSFIILQRLLYIWMKFHYLAILLVGVQDLVLSRSAGYPCNATITHTTGFWKVCNYIEPNQALLAVYQEKMKESRKVIPPQKKRVGLPAFSTYFMLNAKERICEYPLIIYRQSIPCGIRFIKTERGFYRNSSLNMPQNAVF